MKVIFFGSSCFSLPFLNSIYDSGHEIVLVVTLTARGRGRGRKVTSSPVKVFAEDRGLDFFEVDNLDKAATDHILSRQYDYLVLVSFGKILPDAMINSAASRTINVHPSLLPRYRGPSPIITSLLNGDERTGVSLIRISPGIDEGDIYVQKYINISEDDNKDTLEQKITRTGTSMLVELLDLAEDGEVRTYPQSRSGVSYTRIFTKDDLRLDWSRPLFEISNRIRAFSTSPGCFTLWNGKSIKILKAAADKTAEPVLNPGVPSGTVISADKRGLFVRCGDDRPISILKIQPPGRKTMCYVDFINGYQIKTGDIFE